jgi:uncharacterized repeat protein (TIGR01451 family)
MRNNSRVKLFLIGVFLIIPFSINALTVTSAQLQLSPDDECAVYINGALVIDTGTNTINGEWLNVYTVDVSSYFFCGNYVLAINYYDTLASQYRIAYKLTLHLDDGSTVIYYSDGTNVKQYLNGNFLNGTQTFPSGWNNIGFDDSSWTIPNYTCDGTIIPDASFSTGFVPNLSASSGCGVPTAGQSVLVREPFSVQCPVVNISKTINKTTVALGETITYCFNYNNTESSPWTFNIWDTIPGVTDFVGCDHGCTTQTYGSNVVVSWPITVPANGSGSVCTWVAANRYGLFMIPTGYFFAVTGVENQVCDKGNMYLKDSHWNVK